ncbi:MAG TPA: hypothetical protein ENN99_04390 [Chloroflexi bacterium]|nr:hypothetical protein [Chloroflexota bacterium]
MTLSLRLTITALCCILLVACQPATPSPAPPTELPGDRSAPSLDWTPSPAPTTPPPERPTASPTPVTATGWIAFVGPDRQVWLTTPDGQLEGPLTSGGQAWDPAWSADGQTLAYVYQRDGDPARRIASYDLRGGQIAQLSAGEEDPFGSVEWSWSPDRHHLFLSIGTSLVRRLRVIETATDEIVYETGSAGGAYWSPDGHHLAFGQIEPLETPISLETGDSVSLAVLELATGGVSVLLEGTSATLYFPRAWLPDGRLLYEQLAWDERTHRGDWTLWTVHYHNGAAGEPQPAQDIPVAHDREATLARLPEAFQNPSTHSFSWSPDGRWVVFESGRSLYLVNWDEGGEPIHLVDGTSPAWQPAIEIAPPVALSASPALPEVDVAFFRADGLWLYDSATAQERQLVNFAPDLGRATVPAPPVWSPDGQRVAYLTYVEDDPAHEWAHVTVVDLETGATARRTAPPVLVAGGLAWSADGSELYAIGTYQVETGEGRQSLYALPLDPEADPAPLIIMGSDGNLSGPLQLSPEGRLRYLHLLGPRGVSIRQMPAECGEGEIEELAHIPGSARLPFTAPSLILPEDEGLLYLLSTDQMGWEERVGLYRVYDGESRQLIRLEGGCGLEAGLGLGRLVALGCGAAESAPLLICDVETEECRQLHQEMLAVVMPAIVPEDVPLNAVKFVPVGWRGQRLYFAAIPYAAGQPWSGWGALFRYDTQTGNVTPVLTEINWAALAP